ncbi:MAG TPA: acylase [Spirochaetota bacterium]|nr:acylase [Spirochaetota bacterium]
MKSSTRRLAAVLVIVPLILVASIRDQNAAADISSGYDVRILRDRWGVPHVFGKKDTDAAFGLAYAHAEDDFKTMQLVMMAVGGRLASVLGPKGAGNDYLVNLIRLWDTVNARYETDLDPRTRALCEAYAGGVNHYAALHPRETVPGLGRVTGKHIVAGFVHKMPLMVGVDVVLKELFEKPKTAALRPIDSMLAASFGHDAPSRFGTGVGSNAIALSPRRSAGGETMLAINSHQPWEGPVTWYEAHVHSEEGWNMTGGLFPGSPVVFHGHNEYLGWAHTNNYPDLVDVYELDINPDNPNQYRYDGAWRELEVREAPIRVKLLGPLRWTFKEEVLWSVYGPAIRRPHGVFAVRYAGMSDIRQVEQWYRMNRARNMSEWEEALGMATLPMFNCTYADREGNILYHYQALLPLRDEGYDWSKRLPGDTSKTLWTGYLPYGRLPRVKNPASGFVQNCNNTPFRATLDPENPRAEDYSKSYGIELRMTNRALRALELFGSDDSITPEEFYRYKYDMAYSKESKMAKLVVRILALPPSDDPVVKNARDVLARWDLRVDPDNTGAALAVTCHTIIMKGRERVEVADVPERAIANGFAKAARLVQSAHGRVDVPWSMVNRLIRGTTDLGLGGGPDVLHDVTGDLMKDGRFRGRVGDSYVLLVTWDRNGKLSSRSIHQYGSATLDAASKHYADQSPLFARRELKPVWRDESEIRANLEREYRPGEEMTKKP